MFIGVLCVPVPVFFVYWGLTVFGGFIYGIFVYCGLTVFYVFIYGICGGCGM
jgi:hypothetical protein